MKHYLRVGFVLLITVLSSLHFTQASGFENNPGKVLKTKKMPDPRPQFPPINKLQQGLTIQSSLPEATFISKGNVVRSGSRERLFNHFTESGLKVELFARGDNGTISFIRGDLGTIHQVPMAKAEKIKTVANFSLSDAAIPDARAALGWLNKFSASMGVKNAETEFVVKDYTIDTLGKRHVRLQQVYHGIPVWAEEIYVHIDASDRVYAVNGRYEATPVQITNLNPSITADQAFENTKSYLRGIGKWQPIDESMQHFLQIPEPTIEKVIWSDSQHIPHLVWLVDLYANLSDWYYIFIDAGNGQVLQAINNRTHDGFVNAAGVDLNRVTQNFRAYQEGSTYFLLSDINELAGSAADLPDNPTGGVLIMDLRHNDPVENATIYHVTSNNRNSWSDASSVSAMANNTVCYNYYRNTFNRRAIDGTASTIVSIINVTEEGQSMENAFWNGRAMFYGNGGSIFKPLAGALDITAHEMTHGVTQYTANLIYLGQSGALNESMSDVFAVMVDRDDWYLAEDVIQPGAGVALRDMQNPGNPNVLEPQPSNMDQYVYTTEDNGGVHINCGIPNRAAYLVASSIGREKTERIYYRALSNYLTRQSIFIDGRHALEQSAADLYGTTEVNAVKAAFDAVKIVEQGGGGYNPDEDNVRPTAGGYQWIAYIRGDRQIGLYDFDNKADYYLPEARVKAISGNYAQITATADGNYLYFVNDNGNIGVVDVSSLPTMLQYSYHELDDIYVSTPGDLWNVAVSRDNTIFAFTSEYQDDNNVYFYYNNQIYSLELDLPSTIAGIKRNTIQYADVLDWSPNCKYRKLAFDAYNELTLVARTLNWWNMGEVDFSSTELQIYELLPPQPDGVSAGNIEYSSTNPDVFAFNYIDAENHWDIRINDYDHPENSTWLTFPERNVERPSFSPDDQFFVVDRTSDHKLLILDRRSNTFNELSINADAYYPEWFVIGGNFDLEVEDTHDRTITDFTLSQNYPNPFNPVTTIAYNLPQKSTVEMTIYNVRGQKVRTLLSHEQAAGFYQVKWDGTNDAGQDVGAGVYFYTLRADNSQFIMKKMIYLK